MLKKTLLVITCAWIVLLAPSASADRPVAEIRIGTSTIDVLPLVQHLSSSVMVGAADGCVARRDNSEPGPISIDLLEAFGGRLVDGDWRVEVLLTPKLDQATLDLLQAARDRDEEWVIERLRGEGRIPEPMVALATFVVVEGRILEPTGSERLPELLPATGENPSPLVEKAAVLTNNDAVIRNSLCVGLDCPDSPSYSDSTILLTENNTRIKFDDTSTVAGFPNRDWELQGNSPDSGGPNQFALNDCGTSTGGGCADDPLLVVEGNAPANALFVDSSGRVGFRTSNPVLDLHVSDSDTPGLRLEQNSSGGFTAQSWDVAGNETNFFVRDVTGGSRLPFRIRPGAPTSSLDIAADGDIGMGIASPAASLDIRRSGSASEVMATTFSNDGNTFPNFIQRRAGGTSGAPTATQNNNIIGSYSFRGHTGSDFTTENIARLEVRAEENFSTTANGTRIILQTTQNGQTTPQTRMVIKNDGSVGIGTANPTAGSRLEVNGGSIRVTGGSFIDDGTTLNVPDYVFEPDYELRSLVELEAFIIENKHLPGVPSRDDVRKNGLNLSQFQMRLLEKLEELTLYTLQQDKRIAELEARLADSKP